MTSTTAPVASRALLSARPLRCRNCGADRAAGPVSICEQCLGPLDPVYQPRRRLPNRTAIAARAPSLWRYKEWLPFDGDPVLSLDSGFTPLVETPVLARRLGVTRDWIKNDTVCHPSLSFKDRVVAAADSGCGPDGGGLAPHEAAQGVRGVLGRRARRWQGAAPVRRAGERLCADRAAGGARWHTARARSAQHDLPVARDR